MDKERSSKTSKLAVFLFVVSIISIVGTLLSGVSYGSPIYFVINIVISLLVIYWAYYARKRAIKNNLNGVKLANFALYAFAAVLVVEVVGGLILMSSITSLKKFASEKTPNFFVNNLSSMRENATDDLKSILSESVLATISKDFSEVGAVKNCKQEKFDMIDVFYGPDINFNNFSVSLTGNYTMRCYGEKKVFDVDIYTKYENGSWHIDDYTYNVDLEKDFNARDDKSNQ